MYINSLLFVENCIYFMLILLFYCMMYSKIEKNWFAYYRFYRLILVHRQFFQIIKSARSKRLRTT